MTMQNDTGTTWGTTWAGPRRSPALRAVVAVLTAMLMLVGAAAPAMAKPSKQSGDSGSGDTSGSGCDGVLADSATLSLDDVRAGMNADYSATGGGVGVAVIDTGINAVAGLSGQSKLIDGPDLSFDALDENLRHRDLHGHGTNMAAIVAANNSASGDGLAPGSHVVNVKVGAGDGAVDTSQVIAAVDWVVQNRNLNGNNIRVISLSYGTDSMQDYRIDPLSQAVENAWRHGIVVVVAGGNDGRGIHRLGNPAINPYVIAVGAAAPDPGGWKVPSWSSTGDGNRNPDVVAPASSVLSAGVGGSYLASMNPDATCVGGNGDLYLRGSGTSQAAAAVAGAVAMMLEHRPELTPDQVKHLLTSTAIDLGAPEHIQGHGLVDVGAAMNAEISAAAAMQYHDPSVGVGTLEASRGTMHVGHDGDALSGEVTAYGSVWDASSWSAASAAGVAWSDAKYIKGGNVWVGGTWSHATWSGDTWQGDAWTDGTWSGSVWTDATWSGEAWTHATWSTATWSAGTWSDATWSTATWSTATWSTATWSTATWS